MSYVGHTAEFGNSIQTLNLDELDMIGGGLSNGEAFLMGAGAGALMGSAFSPAGMMIGALAGGATCVLLNNL